MLLLTLLASNWYHIVDKSNRAETAAEYLRAYRDSVFKSNEILYLKNQVLLSEKDSLKKEAERKKSEIPKIDSDWNKEIASAKQSVDSNVINRLDSLHKIAIIKRDSIISDQNLAITKLEEVHSNDSTAISNLMTTVDKYSDAYLDLEDSVKKEKGKSFWKGFKWGFGSGYVAGLFSGVAIKK